jgi:hypothetical protein
VQELCFWLSLLGNFVLTSLFMCADVRRRTLSNNAIRSASSRQRQQAQKSGRHHARRCTKLARLAYAAFVPGVELVVPPRATDGVAGASPSASLAVGAS